MLNRRSLQLVVLLLAALLVFTGCPKKKPIEPVDAPTPAVDTTPPPRDEPKVEVKDDKFKGEPTKQEPVERTATSAEVQAKLRTVYFEFDKYDLSDRTRSELRSNAEVLKKNGKAKVVIEGHCDERGTIEYNLALGERRAKAVREYLATLGISSSRMRIVSYGEERPEDFGHNESSWSRNRRAMFVVE